MTQVNLVKVIKNDPSAVGLRTTAAPLDILGSQAIGVAPFLVAVTATSNVVIASTGVGATIDGYTLVADDLVLLQGQTTADENGIYVVGTSSLTIDPFSSFRFANKQFGLTQVLNGTVNAGKLFQQNTVSTTFNGTVFSTPLNFTDIFSASPNNNAPTLAADFVATVAVSAGQVVALDVANVGQVVLNDTTTDTSTSYVPYGIVVTGAAIGGTATVAYGGQVTILSATFTASDMGKNVFADTATAGGYTLTAPSTAGTYQALLGVVSGANQITLQTNLVADLI